MFKSFLSSVVRHAAFIAAYAVMIGLFYFGFQVAEPSPEAANLATFVLFASTIVVGLVEFRSEPGEFKLSPINAMVQTAGLAYLIIASASLGMFVLATALTLRLFMVSRHWVMKRTVEIQEHVIEIDGEQLLQAMERAQERFERNQAAKQGGAGIDKAAAAPAAG